MEESFILEAIIIDRNDMHMEMALTKHIVSMVYLVCCQMILVKNKEKNLIIFLSFMQKNLLSESLFTI